MNAALLRAVLTHVTSYPALHITTTYGEVRPSGEIAADTAGRALLESGWTLVADGTFRSPDGKQEVSAYWEVEDIAQDLLGVSDDDLWAHKDLECLFGITDEDEAVRRLTALTEEAEGAIASA